MRRVKRSKSPRKRAYIRKDIIISLSIVLIVLAIPLTIVYSKYRQNNNAFAQLAGSPTISVADYGTTDDAIQKAANAAAGGTLVFPPGITYTITKPITLPAHVIIQGNGSTLQTAANSTTDTSSDGMLDINSVSTVDISGLTFDGNVQNQGGVWAQWRHAIRVNDSSNVTIHNNNFINLIGDGVYLGTNYTTPPLTCVSNAEIFNNTFAGTHQNRNGVSVVCAKDIKIHDNTFTGMGRPDMPGSVDLEPNNANQFLTNIRVSANKIYNGDAVSTTTARAQYGILYWGVNNPQANTVSFTDNLIDGGQVGFKQAGIIFGGAKEATVATNLLASGNTIINASSDVELDWGVTANITNNTLSNPQTNDGYGINNWYACLIQSGNTINSVYKPILEMGSTCGTAVPAAVLVPSNTPVPSATLAPVSDITPPSVSIVSPANYSTLRKGSTYAILVSATDNISVSRVDFYVNNARICTDTTSPYSCNWKENKGTYTLKAVAYDTAGNSRVSANISITAK